MSGFKDIAKGGWHPKGKDGNSKESWRGDFKGINQVAGWMGKGKSSSGEAPEHTSQPISTLKDPSSFGPPPKNANYHGGAAFPNQTTPDRNGLGRPLSTEDIAAQRAQEEEEEAARQAEEAEARKPPVPYRANTSGLRTSHLPPPPIRRDGADGSAASTKPPAPRLPPRLPPRQNSNPSAATPPAPPPYSAAVAEPAHRGILNQGSLNRLSAAGVSVPGFGIGNKQPPPPPARSAAASPAPSTSSSQMNELQSRFSRLSSSSPKPEAPSQGTTFAQKQAALKTASSFRNNPSSVSLSDAKAAASTANNFRERHGEQVKSGWASANKLNTKYGIADKVGAYGAPAQASTLPQPEERTASPGIELRDNTVVKKKPPPPPPTKRANLTANGVKGEGTPPPIPLSSKPKPPTSRSNGSYEPKDFDLDLDSEWYAKGTWPPPPLVRLPGKRSYACSSGWSQSAGRKTHHLDGAIRDSSTLATTNIHLVWDASWPKGSVKVQQRHSPPPRKLNSDELEIERSKYSNAVADWCAAQVGTKVGDGECWTLANEALKAVAADCASRHQEPCMTSQSLVHGYLIYSYLPAVSPYPDPKGGVLEAGVARGDIIQFLKTHFKAKNGMREAWAGMPDHTSVVTAVEPDGVLKVLEQNNGGVKIVGDGKYDMSELVGGEVRIFRAVGENWVGKLDPAW
ncbi:hypothetical protein BP6252_02157 [Coleophoma cylindrospora]|uniref:BBC1/AIM3 cysteine proteinase-fold domain-containing protein n=1 Tax=Coleophoma cylindrospora TaxID=1849047 RepID=A0A3D8SDZ1_9HELO|nr:hypothetical protein BP6252_02157 [Coleophoma cylindrospora]